MHPVEDTHLLRHPDQPWPHVLSVPEAAETSRAHHTAGHALKKRINELNSRSPRTDPPTPTLCHVGSTSASLSRLSFPTEIPFLNPKDLCSLVRVWIPLFTGTEKFCCHVHVAAYCLSLQPRIPFKKGFLFVSLHKFPCYLSSQALLVFSPCSLPALRCLCYDLFSPLLSAGVEKKTHFLHFNCRHEKKH